MVWEGETGQLVRVDDEGPVQNYGVFELGHAEAFCKRMGWAKVPIHPAALATAAAARMSEGVTNDEKEALAGGGA